MHHHFSDDDEEEEENEALIDDAELNLLAQLPAHEDQLLQGAALSGEPPKPSFLSVTGPDGEDLVQHFDKNYVVVERILSTTVIFPVIHPRQAKQIRGRWQEDCLKVVNVLINYRKNNVSLGLAFAEQLDPENEELANYFKIVKQPIDFIMITNRLYNRSYNHPQEFWNDLGLVFKNCRQYHKSSKMALRKQCDLLRCLAFHLYNDWYQEMQTRFTTGVAMPISQQQQSSNNNINQQVAAPTPASQQQVPNLQGTSSDQFERQAQQQAFSTRINLQSLLSIHKPQQQDQKPEQQQQNFQNPEPNNQIQHQSSHSSGGAQFQAPQNLPKFNMLGQNLGMMGIPQQMNQNQVQQIDWMQGGSNQVALNALGNPLLGQGNSGMLPSITQGFDMSGRQIQLPTIGQIGQNLMVQPNIGLAMGGNPFMGIANISALQGQLPSLSAMSPFMTQQISGQIVDMNQIQAIQNMPNLSANDKNMLISQIISGNQTFLQQPAQFTIPGLNIPIHNAYDQITLMGQGGQDFNINQLLNAQQALRNQGSQQFGLPQLPSLPSIQGMTNVLGPQSFQLPTLQQVVPQQLQSNLNTFDPYQMSQTPRLSLPPGLSSTQGGTNGALDEMSMLISMQQQQQQQQQFNPFHQLAQLDLSQQALKRQMPQQNQMQQQQIMQRMQPQQPTQKMIIDPNMLEEQNEKAGNEAPVQPCIIDPGMYDLTWILIPGESKEELEKSPYINAEEIKVAIASKNNVDQLYLVKWRGLSYTSSTWEPESLFKSIFEDRIQDYSRYNRSLDQFQRDRLDQLVKNHKKMLRVTEKKYQTQHPGGSKKVDPVQESFMGLQEARVNRQLLNTKIQEVMGDAYYQVWQYSEKNGVVPKFKKPHQQLKNYQVSGLNWLIRAWHEHRNVVLADEMGLGKTIMTLSLFDHLNKVYKLRGPFLILAPLTTLEHWKRIADEWTSMNSVLYYDPGSAEGREQIRQWEWFFTDVTYKGTITQKSELYKFNIMITSFEVFMSDLNPILQEIPFIYIVVDEAHRLKNKQAKTLKLLKDHPCKRILLLTGTPVQNNTKELWTLLNYIEPEKFNNMDQFMEDYGNLESYEQIQKLHKILRPHFLRRLKEEVEDSIPPLNETVVEVGLTSLQNTYYKGIYGENRMVLAKFGTNSIKTSQLNNMDVQLRKCCNHLFLLKGVEEELTRDCRTDEDLYNKLLESSGKLMLLDKFIEKFKKENHKMLIFSQFKRMLDIIELYLKMKAVPYEKLTGSVKNQDRVSAIQRFNDNKTQIAGAPPPTDGNNFGVFLLTTRAGGLGINLTSARVVIIFDSDWNPQNDLQAIARAHRIGQKFEVQVYRLITSKTYEEQMFERASKKLGMEQALFSKGAFNQLPTTGDDQMLQMEGGLQLRPLTDLKQDSKEIENLLKYGAYAFMDEGGENADDVKNKDIDEILATGKKKEFQYNKGVYTLQKSTFNASKYEKGALPDVNDPEFWNKVLPYDQIISITVLEKKFKKEKKEIGKSDKEQIEFIKDLEIVFNDFIDTKFDNKVSAASRKQFESDEETLRELLKKMIKLSGMKLIFVEKCKEWLREMLRTSKRKKPTNAIAAEGKKPGIEEDLLADDDIIMYDSGEERPLRNSSKQQEDQKEESDGEANRRPQRSRKVKDYDEGGGLVAVGEAGEGGEGEYVEDEDEEAAVENGKRKRRSVRQMSSIKVNNDNEEDMSGEEDRYGLRRKKRQKLDKAEATSRHQSLLLQHQQSSLNLQDKLDSLLAPKPMYQNSKRNEKNGIVCAHCLQPETVEHPCPWFCQSYCQRSFHPACKDALFPGELTPSPALWHCEDCSDNKAICYCCKKKGAILVFPKKGKPKAAGLNTSPSVVGNNMDEDLIEQQERRMRQEEEEAEEEKKEEEEEMGGFTNQMEAIEEPDPNDTKYVVRCTLGGCFKYYHVKCVYLNKNVSCINSMKVQRFRCPLHYCEICQASGDSVLIVQCVACPTAYHVKCMPKGDPNAIRLTKKFVICQKHNMSIDDFPRFEDKQQSFTVTAATPKVSSAALALAGGGVDEGGRPAPKKRGRKPRSHYLALAAAEAAASAQRKAEEAAAVAEEEHEMEQQDEAVGTNAEMGGEDEDEDEFKTTKMPWQHGKMQQDDEDEEGEEEAEDEGDYDDEEEEQQDSPPPVLMQNANGKYTINLGALPPIATINNGPQSYNAANVTGFEEERPEEEEQE